MSHSIKVWEKVMEKKLKGKTTMSKYHFGFMPKKVNNGTNIFCTAINKEE